MYRRYISLILCVFLLAGTLSGCGKDRERTLVFSHWDVENQQVYKTLAEAYEKEHTGLTIEVRAVEREQYTDIWLRSVSEKKTADVFAVPADEDFQRFIGSGALRELSGSNILPVNYDSALQLLGSRDGQTWAIPITGSIPVVFYNEDYFQQYGLTAPQTIADFVIACSILQQNNAAPFAMSEDDGGLWDTADFIEGIMANGPRDTSLMASGKFFEQNKELDSGFKDVVGLALELTLSDLLAGKEDGVRTRQALLEQFAQGTYAMIPGNTNDIQKLRALAGELHFGFFAMPGSNTSAAGVFKADMMLGISKKSKVMSDAEGFVSYLLSPSSQKLLCDSVLRIPASDDVKLTDKDLAEAQSLLYSADDKYLSLFQRISSDERAVCLEKLDLAFSGESFDFVEFMYDWADKIKQLTS